MNNTHSVIGLGLNFSSDLLAIELLTACASCGFGDREANVLGASVRDDSFSIGSALPSPVLESDTLSSSVIGRGRSAMLSGSGVNRGSCNETEQSKT